MTPYIDGHCHLNSPELRGQLDRHIDEARSAGVQRMLVVGTDLRTSEEAISISRGYLDSGIRASVGIHPHDASSVSSSLPEELTDLAKDPVVVAIGEIGLDYHYNYSPVKVQRDVMISQILWAEEADLPIVFHVRDAFDDFFSILRDYPVGPERAVVHCFSGSLKEAKSCLDLGFYLGFGGMITFKKADGIRECLASCPIDRVILETDSPWLAPVPFRGKINSPLNMPLIYKAAAEVLKVRDSVMADAVWTNGMNFYRWENE
jgi:TatD DNase family protein